MTAADTMTAAADTPTPPAVPTTARAGSGDAVIIRLRRRSHDWHAQIGNDARLWGCGRSQGEAIGNLVMSHPERLGLDIVFATNTAQMAAATPESR